LKRWSITALFALLWAGPAAADDCAERTSSGDISLALEGAEARFAARDKDGVFTFADTARAAIPCLRDELGVSISARFHRLQGLRAFLNKDNERAGLWFAASRQVQPDAVLSESLVPPGHPLQGIFDGAGAPVDVERLGTPAEGRLRFDGADGTDRPVKRPTIFQYIDGSGTVKRSALLDVGDPTPVDGISFAKPSARGGAAGVGAAGGRTAKIALLSGSGAALVASVVTFGLAHGAQNRYDDTAVTAKNKGKLEQLYKSNRTLGVVSGVSAGVAVSLGVGAVFVGSW
jgi:hypothetical protein